MTDEVWAVICETMAKYRGLIPSPDTRERIETGAEIEEFDGGAFVAIGNEFDLFILPERRGGRWRVRSTIRGYMRKMISRYGSAVVRIHRDNSESLRLAKGFGFAEIGHEGDMIRLEVR